MASSKIRKYRNIPLRNKDDNPPKSDPTMVHGENIHEELYTIYLDISRITNGILHEGT